jgi:hypothetical protein
MGLLYFPKIKMGQNRIKFCKRGLWLFLLPFTLNTAFGQVPLLEKTIRIPRQNTTLYEALNLISQKADCFFIYDSENVKSDKRVKLYADNQSLKKVLDNILLNTGLEYKVLGKHILICKTKQDEYLVNKAQPIVSHDDTIKNIVI